MITERDPRVVKVAERLALAYPYGFEYVKSGPSGADYHAAIIAVKALDEDVEYEYAVQIITGPRAGDLVPLWSDRKDRQDFIDDLYEYSDAHNYKLVKRRNAGPVEDA